jgi:hypothetical protein
MILGLLGLVTGCVTSRALAPLPSAGLQAGGNGVTARVKRVHLKWGNGSDQGPDQVVIEVANHTRRAVRLIPRRITLVELQLRLPARDVPLENTDPSVPAVDAGSAAFHGGVAGARIGSSLSGALRPGGTTSGLGGLAGGVGGAFVGAAAAVVIAVPIVGYLVVDRLIRETDRSIAPGKTRSLRISLGQVALEARERYALDLRTALEPPAEMGPLPLVDVTDVHYGYGPPTSFRWIWLLRLGGGAIWEGPTTGGLGGAELFFGRQWRRLSAGGYAMLGLGSVGLEMRYQQPVGRWLALVPFAGYGYAFAAGRFGWAVGHGPRVGLELDFPVAQARRLNYEHNLFSLGIYGHAGPMFIHERDGVGLTAQFGMVLGMF